MACQIHMSGLSITVVVIIVVLVGSESCHSRMHSCNLGSIQWLLFNGHAGPWLRQQRHKVCLLERLTQLSELELVLVLFFLVIYPQVIFHTVVTLSWYCLLLHSNLSSSDIAHSLGLFFMGRSFSGCPGIIRMHSSKSMALCCSCYLKFKSNQHYYPVAIHSWDFSWNLYTGGLPVSY